MKSALKLILLLSAVWITWKVVKDRRRADFKYNLPEIKKSAVANIDSLPEKFYQPMPRIYRGLPTTEYRTQLARLNRLLFDTLHLEQLKPEEIASASVAQLDAQTLIHLLAYNRCFPENAKRFDALITTSALLKNKRQSLQVVRYYLMSGKLWIPAMRRHHRLLMQEHGNTALKNAYMTLLLPADTKQTLEYMKDVQYLEKDPWEDYYRVNTKILDRFDTDILSLLLSKVDDYRWYAAYPERDAEQGILKLIDLKK